MFEDTKLEKVEDVVAELERDLREAKFLHLIFYRAAMRKTSKSSKEERAFLKDHLQFLVDGRSLIEDTLSKVKSIPVGEIK